MLDSLANKPALFFSGIAFFVMILVLAGRITNHKIRTLVRVSAAFLAFPVAYMGHPFLFGSVWMLVVAGICTPAPLPLAIVMAIWAAIFFVSLFILRLNDKGKYTEEQDKK